MTPGGLVLGLDTSGEAGSVALCGEGPDRRLNEVERSFTEGLIHGVALAPAVAALLEEAGALPADLALIAVGTGPGSYTGVRVGVAFAKSLSFATGVPAIGVPSLDAMAWSAPRDRPVVCARDARRGSLYLAVYPIGDRDRPSEGGIRLVPPASAARDLPPDALVIGDAIKRFGGSLSGEGRVLGDRGLWRSPAIAVARLGRARAEAEGTASAHDLAPFYLRLPEAEERLRRSEGTE